MSSSSMTRPHDEEEDEEAMFEFDDEGEEEEYEKGQQAVREELTRAAANAAASSSSTSSSATADSTSGGIATVVVVNIIPSMLACDDGTSVSASSASTVDVGFQVIDRFVPHLNANKSETLPEAGNITAESLQPQTVAAASSASSSSSKSPAVPASSASSSDSDSDSAIDVDTTGADLILTGDREQDQQMLSALMAKGGDDEQMDDGSDEDGSDDGSDDDDDDDIALRAQAANLEDIDSDEEPEAVLSKVTGIYTKNELKPSDIPAPAEFAVKSDLQIDEIGIVSSIMGRLLVIATNPTAANGRKALDIGSAVCTVDRQCVGRIEEVMGAVSEPYYAVRLCESFNTKSLPDPLMDDDDDDDNQSSSSSSSSSKTKLYFVPSLSTFASADTQPGTDASNLFDEEVNDDEREYSDDEQEMEAKAFKKKQSKIKAQEKRLGNIEKEKMNTVMGMNVLPGAMNTSSNNNSATNPRQTFKAKRQQNNQNNNNQNQNNNNNNPTATATVPSTLTPAQTPVQPLYIPSFSHPSSSSNAPLLPMPGSTQQPPHPYYHQPFQPHAYPQQPHPYPLYAAPSHPSAPPPAAAYAAYYSQNPHAAAYHHYPHPYQQQQQQQPPPQGVAGGFAGWGASNLATSLPHPAAGYPPPAATYCHPPYPYHPQPSNPFTPYMFPGAGAATPPVPTPATQQNK